MKLGIEPIPEGSWGLSLAHLLPKPVWDTLRREVYAEYGYKCCICGATDKQLHCHEVWEYKGNVQRLVNLQCICVDCHNIKHWGRTVAMLHNGEFTQEYFDSLKRHFCKVNNCSEREMLNYIVEVGMRYAKRSDKKYRIDFGKFEPNKVVRIWGKSR